MSRIASSPGKGSPDGGRNALHILIVAGCAAALFAAACSEGPTDPQPGSLRVSIVTVGGDLDQDGYVLTVGQEPPIATASDATLVLENITAGTHSLALAGVAGNCIVAEGTPNAIAIPPGGMAEVKLTVTCETTGIQIITRTTGADQTLHRYLVKNGERSGSVGPNGTVLVSRLTPGTHTVSLTVDDNCIVTSGAQVSVNVLNRTVSPVTFDITCTVSRRLIAFARVNAAPNAFPVDSILVSNADGSSVQVLAKGRNPSWSPDGTKLAYSVAECDFYYGECTGGVAILDLTSRLVTVPGNAVLGADPSWSPDGTLIAFSRFTGSFGKIQTLQLAGLDGSPAKELPIGAMNATHPTWSPDGRRIAFGCSIAPLNELLDHDICVINRDGTGLVKLASEPGYDGFPDWSPDGTEIVFQTSRFGGEPHVAIMTASGTNVRRLTLGWTPTWSGDGSKVVFARGDGLFTSDSYGLNLTRITTGKDSRPAWRPEPGVLP